jgi:hypothetical protein
MAACVKKPYDRRWTEHAKRLVRRKHDDQNVSAITADTGLSGFQHVDLSSLHLLLLHRLRLASQLDLESSILPYSTVLYLSMHPLIRIFDFSVARIALACSHHRAFDTRSQLSAQIHDLVRQGIRITTSVAWETMAPTSLLTVLALLELPILDYSSSSGRRQRSCTGIIAKSPLPRMAVGIAAGGSWSLRYRSHMSCLPLACIYMYTVLPPLKTVTVPNTHQHQTTCSTTS